MGSYRIQKVNELIRQKLAKILQRELNLSAGSLVTVIKVETSADLSQARVKISVLPETSAARIETMVREKSGFFRSLLSKELVIRKVPKLLFDFDNSQAKAERINMLIDKIHQSE